MKIFLCESKTKKSPSSKMVFTLVLTFLSALLLFAQGYMFFESSIMPASNSEPYPGSDKVITLKASGSFGESGAVVYVDGEKHKALTGDEVTINPGRGCVIEVLAGEGADFSVEALISGNVQIVSGSTKAKCTKGMNFICRCYCPD